MNWTKDWHLDFNIEKCKTMRIGHKLDIAYKLNGVQLQEVQEEKDLGITVANNLKPSSQCAKAAAKAMLLLHTVDLRVAAVKSTQSTWPLQVKSSHFSSKSPPKFSTQVAAEF